MRKRVDKFLKKSHIMTLATCHEGECWSTPLFYAYNVERGIIIFSSNSKSRHITQGMKNHRVSCSIFYNSTIIAKLKGAQITAKLHSSEPNSPEESELRATYLSRFPFAANMLERMWYIEIKSVKYTDNSFGFGKKYEIEY